MRPRTENLDGEELSDDEVPGLADDDGDPGLAPLHDVDGVSYHSDDAESDDESVRSRAELDGASGEAVATASILHLFAHELFGWSRSSSHGVRGACVNPVAVKSKERGCLTDEHAWAVMGGVMNNHVADAVLWTPGSATFRDQGNGVTPALRGPEGKDLHGLSTSPDWARDDMKREDL